jgi:hypothetical protein
VTALPPRLPVQSRASIVFGVVAEFRLTVWTHALQRRSPVQRKAFVTAARHSDGSARRARRTQHTLQGAVACRSCKEWQLCHKGSQFQEGLLSQGLLVKRSFFSHSCKERLLCHQGSMFRVGLLSYEWWGQWGDGQHHLRLHIQSFFAIGLLTLCLTWSEQKRL